MVVAEVASRWMSRHFDEEQKKYILANFFRRVDIGAISQDEMYAQMAQRYNMNKQDIIDEWDELSTLMPETVEVIRRLKAQGHAVALLSNASVERIDYLFGKFDLFQYFDKIFVSANYGCAKPDREFYQICLDSFTEKFEKIYFTDDNPENLKGIEDLGITPILFTSAKQFEQDVKTK